MAKEFCGSAKNNFRSRLGPSLPARLEAILSTRLSIPERRFALLGGEYNGIPDLEYPDSNKTGAYATSAIGRGSGSALST